MANQSPPDQPNLASSKTTNGTPKETNTPKTPEGVNSSISKQNNGPSLPKLSQGVLANTATSINNALPAHGCPVKMQVMFDKFELKMKQLIEAEVKELSEFFTWKAESFAPPIVETIKNAIQTVMDMVKEIQRYIDILKELINDIMEFIKELQELIQAIMGLAARLMQMVMDCLGALTGALGKMVTTQIDAVKNAASASTGAVSANSTTSTT